MNRKLMFVALILLTLSQIFTNRLEAQEAKRKNLSAELTKRAVNLYQEQKYDRAKENLLRAVRLDDKNVKAQEMLALLYYQERNFPEAIKCANRAIEINKETAGAYYVLGMISYQSGKEEQAKSNLTQAVRLLSDTTHREQAKKILNQLREKASPDGRISIREKIRQYREKKDTPEAVNGYKPFVAVFNFEDANVRTEGTGLGQTVTEMLVTALIQDGRFTVMERVQLEKLLQEQSLSQSGVIDTETAIQVGKVAGLEAVILGSVSRLKTAIEADARLIDIETAKALAAANASVVDVDNVRDLAKELASQLANKVYLIEPKNEGGDSTGSATEK